MRKKHGVIAGLVFVVALGAPAAAQATALPSGSAHAGGTATAAAPDNCNSLWDYGNQKYAAINNNSEFLTFEPLSTLGAAPLFCNETDPDMNGGFLMLDYSQSGECLGETVYNTTTGYYQIGDMSCNGRNTADVWFVYATHGSYHGNTLYQLQNSGASGLSDADECLYDDTQEPAVLGLCSSTSDHFEWFVWTVGL